MESNSAPSTAPPWNTTTPGDNYIPRFVTYTSPVSLGSADGGAVRATTLPLNLIALIISYLDDLADVSRVTRTSKLLYCTRMHHSEQFRGLRPFADRLHELLDMTLPQLYSSVSLHSYPDVRYINGRPEGFGSGSPFIMALNGLVTKSHAAIVQHIRFWGQWNEIGAEDFAKGRVPDSTQIDTSSTYRACDPSDFNPSISDSMMLNILLRAAIDRMTKLQSFSWELDCKPLKTLYQGLGAHNSLTSLTLKFPRSRSPRPSVMIPPMANLRVFKALDIDPLCYPDDFSVMLLHSKKLEDLRIHFSPRIRQQAESSLSLDTYFGRCLAAGYKIPLKHLAIQNFYGPNSDRLARIVDESTCVSMCAFDMFGGINGNVMNKFYDDTWKDIPLHIKSHLKKSRTNEPADQHVALISRWTGLEYFYMVNSRASRNYDPESPQPFTPAESPPHHGTLGKDYVYALTRYHGSTLRHLLMSDQWLLDDEDIGEIVRHCPNLEQLAFAASSPGLGSLHLLIPSLSRLQSVRFIGTEAVRNEEFALDRLNHRLGKTGAKSLRYVGLGDRVMKLGGSFQDPHGNWTTDVKEVQFDDVKHVEIWGLDNLDIGADPVAPFSP